MQFQVFWSKQRIWAADFLYFMVSFYVLCLKKKVKCESGTILILKVIQ